MSEKEAGMRPVRMIVMGRSGLAWQVPGDAEEDAVEEEVPERCLRWLIFRWRQREVAERVDWRDGIDGGS
jgi:hypothetical protein